MMDGATSPRNTEQLIQQFMTEQHSPGLAMGVQQGSEMLYEGYHGLANLEHQVPVSAASVFEIASVTKPFTAQAVLRLAQDGKLKLNDTLSTHLPNLPEAWNGVTVTHCLRHQSGIPNYMQHDAYWETSRLDKSADEILALVRDQPLEFQPGDRFAYTNTGFYLLGMLIEAISGQSYGDYLKRTIFDPLGMTSTQYNDYDQVIPHRVQGYELGPDGRLNNKAYRGANNALGAAGLVTSVRDLLRWRTSLFDDTVLNAEYRAQSWTPMLSAQGNEKEFGMTAGLGWLQLDGEYGKFWGHNGATDGFASTFLYFLDSDITVVVLCNTMIDAMHTFAITALGTVLEEG